MPENKEIRVAQFAYTLLDANIPSLEVYQECINFIQACKEQESDGESLFLYKITPEIMEQAAKAVSDAHNKLDELAWKRRTPNNAENWLQLEKKA